MAPPHHPTNRILLFFQILAIIVIFLLMLLALFEQNVSAALLTLSQNQCGSPALEPVKASNLTPTIFHENYPYQTWNSSADELWDAILPPNGGFIIDAADNDAPIYGIAMFHQLHCIAMFRSDFQELYARLEGRSDGKSRVVNHIDEEHTLHCLDYLRQVNCSS